MKGFINYFKKDIKRTSLVSLVVVLFVFITILIIENTFAAGEYTIVFNRAEGNEVLKTCETDYNGKLDEDCIYYIKGICSQWSTYPYIYVGYYQDDRKSISDLENMVFAENNDYYCVAQTSVVNWKNNIGCYVCNDDENIMRWSTNNSGDSKCPGGYTKNSSINENNCKISDVCYVCNNDNNVMKWDNNGNSDSKCSSGYTKDTSISQSNCKSSACYVCDDDSNIMEWKNNGNSDSKCSSGYTKDTSISQSNCKSSACYVCNNDSNVMKWDNNGNSDNKCSSGYTENKNIPQNQCVTISNPQTGNILIFIVWVVGIFSLTYALCFYKSSKKLN